MKRHQPRAADVLFREINRTLRGDFILVLAGGATVASSEGFRAKVKDYLGTLRFSPT